MTQYFECSQSRQRDLNEMFEKFNVSNGQWVNIETDIEAKGRIKEHHKRHKFKWPNLPKQSNNASDVQDWRLPLALSVLKTLDEPFKSYFLTTTLCSPSRNMMAPALEAAAQRAAGQGSVFDA